MNSLSPQKICCRPIAEADIEAVIPLLVGSFPSRTKAYWSRAFERLAARPVIGGRPRFGLMVACGDRPVAVLLLIHSLMGEGAERGIRCNLSSWCVEPEFAAYSSVLIKSAIKLRENICYLNISPAAHTWRTIEAQGFARYSDGQHLAAPVLSLTKWRVKVRNFNRDVEYRGALRDEEMRLLADHADYGCIALTCSEEGAVHPFVFVARSVRVGALYLPGAQLCYCRDIADFRRFAGPLGRALALRGRFYVLVDANGPVPGLAGRYFPGKAPKYFRGLTPPRLGDIAYTEAALFGA